MNCITKRITSGSDLEDDILVMGIDRLCSTDGRKDSVRPIAGPKASSLSAGKKFAKIESGKWVGKVFSPVSGVLGCF